MTLDQLKPGQQAIIASIDGEGPLVQRLMALGLLEGSEVILTRRALGGDPIEIELMGYALSLRKDEARRVEVKDVRG
ncbi:MAG TPA: ferrous iron transport protein A [Chromatiales bacterium]|nr:ferrous iron transport protein A [Chromatiales bacterium]